MFGLTSLERTTKLECLVESLKNKTELLEDVARHDKNRIDKLQEHETWALQHINDIWDANNKYAEIVRNLTNPNWNKEPEDRLKVMHESEETTAWQLIDTPFVIAKEKEDYYVVCGTFRLNDAPFKTLVEALNDADRKDWQRTMVMTQMLIENNNAMLITNRQQRRKLIKK